MEVSYRFVEKSNADYIFMNADYISRHWNWRIHEDKVDQFDFWVV